MFILETPINEWIKTHPELESSLDSFCQCNTPDIKPFIAQKMIGLRCMKCNSGTWIKRTKEQNTHYITLLGEL